MQPGVQATIFWMHAQLWLFVVGGDRKASAVDRCLSLRPICIYSWKLSGAGEILHDEDPASIYLFCGVVT